MEFFGYLALIGIGMMLGAMGTGGSILAIPVLVYLFSIDMVMASAYSMFLVGTTSLAGAFVKQKKQLIDARAAIVFGVPSVVTTFIGRKWIITVTPEVIFQTASFRLMKDELLLCLFSLLMIASSVAMIVRRDGSEESEGSFRNVPLMLAGVAAGLLAGLVGVGGGFLILPALLFLARLPFRRAVGTTLLIIAANSLLGFCGDLLNHSINWFFLLSATGLALLGLYVGAKTDTYLFTKFSLKKFFGWITLVTGTIILIKELCL